MSSVALGRALAEGLVANGIRHVVVCPGSRSTAAAIAFAESADRGLIDLHTRTDERVAGFLALGLAKAAGCAAVLVTSGTAVGNLMPAVMEARSAGVSLVIITADRPATLIGTGANQTCRQMGIFASQVVDELDLASCDGIPKAWLAQITRVLIVSRGIRTRQPGPVHINAHFTEPLVEPDCTSPTKFGAQADQQTALNDNQTSSSAQVVHAAASRPSPRMLLKAGPRTVVLAGDAPAHIGRRARELAESAGLPLFAEPTSNARFGQCAIANYRLLVDSELGKRIERVIVFGHPTLSRPISRLLSRDDSELIVVSEQANWPDPGWSADQVADDVDCPEGSPEWLALWKTADRECSGSAVLSDPLSGPTLVRAVLDSKPQNLVFGASSLIRDADLCPIVAQSGRPESVCWANRGLAGIDGVMSTAMGIALAKGQPVTVVIGDLGFLHDAGCLHIPLGQPVPNLRILVVDDNGGSIFSTLEVCDSPHYEQLFAMPHGRDLVSIAAGYGWPSWRISTADELAQRVSKPPIGMEILVAVLST